MMTGVYLFWDRTEPGQTRAQQFSGAMRTGGRAPETHLLRGAILCGDGGEDPGTPLPRLGDGRALLFSGFIANRRTLRRELAGDRDLRSAGDGALYAAARDRWGDDADHHVIGEYAAILVPPERGPVELVRSPIMAPALYVWRDADRLIATTTVQAIFATGEVPRTLDDHKLADALLLNYGDERRGWFCGVTRVPRGARVQATPDALHEQTFYRIDDIAPLRLPRDDDYVEAADALLCEAVEDVLDGFSHPAVALSGGLDSQAVAACAMRLYPDRPLLAGTSVPQAGWVPPDPGALVDESPHARALGAMYPQLAQHWITSEGRDFGHHQRELFEVAMAPPRNCGNLHWVHDLHTTMRDAGADVLLTGAMGNLTLSYVGTGALPDMVRSGQVASFLREVWLGGPRWKAGHRALRDGVVPFLPRPLRQRFYRWRDSAAWEPLETWSPIHPDFARSHDVFARAEAMGMDTDFAPVSSVAGYRHALLDHAANEGGDIGTGMDRLHGLPSRDPTRHRRLLEFCFAIPDTQYVNRRRKRWLARRMLAGKVPAMVLNEARRGRQAADWFSRVAPARAQLIDELDWLMTDPEVAGRLDLPRLRQALIDMPDDEAALDHRQFLALRLALARGITTARFIRFLNGRNDV